MAWIESHQELRNHPKTRRLARAMGISVPAAIGHLQCLWWWATDYAQDGDLTRYEDWEIADGAYYEGEDAAKFKEALVYAGFLDDADGTLTIHDWENYGGKNLKRQKAANERNRRYRERQHVPEEECNECVTSASRDGNECVTSASRDGNECVTRPSQDAHTGQDRTRHDNKGNEKTRDIKEEPPYTPLEGEVVRAPSLQQKRFGEFWDAYPRKTGKGAAEKAWMKIKPDAALHDRIMTSVSNNARDNPQWQKDNGQYIPNPATWLNQKRWEDEWKPVARSGTEYSVDENGEKWPIIDGVDWSKV